jgi:hypothetical protein
MSKAPLLIGYEASTVGAATVSTLTNLEVIVVNQDPLTMSRKNSSMDRWHIYQTNYCFSDGRKLIGVNQSLYGEYLDNETLIV